MGERQLSPSPPQLGGVSCYDWVEIDLKCLPDNCRWSLREANPQTIVFHVSKLHHLSSQHSIGYKSKIPRVANQHSIGYKLKFARETATSMCEPRLHTEAHSQNNEATEPNQGYQKEAKTRGRQRRRNTEEEEHQGGVAQRRRTPKRTNGAGT